MEMAVDFWINGRASLFWTPLGPDSIVWLAGVEVLRIRWSDELEASLFLRGYLPEAAHFLSNFRNGDELTIRYIETGEYRDPENGDLIMSFRSCEILKKWIDHPVILNPADKEPIAFYMRLKCRFELP